MGKLEYFQDLISQLLNFFLELGFSIKLPFLKVFYSSYCL